MIQGALTWDEAWEALKQFHEFKGTLGPLYVVRSYRSKTVAKVTSVTLWTEHKIEYYDTEPDAKDKATIEYHIPDRRPVFFRNLFFAFAWECKLAQGRKE